jgi:enoyl-CoA hydratase
MSYHHSVSYEVQSGLGFLSINRPEALNALNKQVFYDLLQVCEKLAEHDAPSVLVVKGAGEKAFVAGADIKEMQEMGPDEAMAFSMLGMRAMRVLETLPQVVIASVQGFALGGGLELALSCDFIVASDKAQFGMPEVGLGLIPGFGGTQRLARKIGPARAMEWITTAARYNASEAFACGLVNHVVAQADLDTFTDTLARKVLKNSPKAVRAAKHALKIGLESTFIGGCALENAAFGLRFSCDESREGIGAFLEKRPAEFVR